MNSTALIFMCEKVGHALTGRQVQLRFQEPVWKGAKGTAFRRENVAVVDVVPGLPEKEFLYVYLHELAHVKFLWNSWTLKVPEFQPGSLRLPDAYRTSPVVSKIEQDAEHQAQEWLDFAERHVKGVQAGSWLTKRLKVLENYQNLRLRDIVERGVKAGVEDALKQVQLNLKGR